MQEHNLIADLFGAITLPLFLILALGVMSGMKTDGIIKFFMEIVAAVITGVFKLIGLMLQGIFGEAARLIRQNRNLRETPSSYRSDIHKQSIIKISSKEVTPYDS